MPIVEYLASLRLIEANQQLHERGLARARWSHERNCVTPLKSERDVVQRGCRRRLVRESDVPELESVEIVHGDGVGRLRILRNRQYLPEVLQGYLGFAIRVDDVPE